MGVEKKKLVETCGHFLTLTFTVWVTHGRIVADSEIRGVEEWLLTEVQYLLRHMSP